MITTLCQECEKEPVHIKKDQLCSSCYNKKRRQKARTGVPDTPAVRSDGEIEFITNYFTHSNWRYQPATFNLLATTYTPDFYDCEKSLFIEVVSTRQAFHQNRQKYKLFRIMFPLLPFEIRKTNGDLLEEENGHYMWSGTKQNNERENGK